jgi:ABC-2 type transport system permease protein
MTAIIKRIFKDRYISLMAYSIGGIVLVLMYVALIPSFQQSQLQLQEVLKALPENLMKAFGMTGVDMSTLEALLAIKQYNMVWPMLLMFFSVSLGGSMIAGEVENRTIELVLSSAKSRVQIFIAKYLAGLAYVVIFVVSTTLCAIPLAKLFGYSAVTANYFTLMYLSLALAFAIYGLTMLFSSIFSSKGKVFGLSGLSYVAMYVLFILVELKDSLDKLKYFSFFYYYNINDALLYNKLDITSILVFVGVGLISSIVALIIFNSRDFAV